VAFLEEDKHPYSLVVISKTGKYTLLEFDPINGGEC